MAAGTRRKGIQTVKWRVDIPADLAFRFEKLPSVYDTSRCEVIFGKRSQILTELLKQYIISEETSLLHKASLVEGKAA